MPYTSAMTNLADIIKRRTVPGTLIFDVNGALHFMNKEAGEMLPDFKGYPGPGKFQTPYVLEEIRDVCEKLQGVAWGTVGGQGGHDPTRLTVNETGMVYSLRAFFIDHTGGENRSAHIMVLIEKIIDRHDVDYDKARGEFSLSRRELEVLKFISCGLANKEIAEKMFISAYTVKDHIKSIMRKMNVNSRNEIVAELK